MICQVPTESTRLQRSNGSNDGSGLDDNRSAQQTDSTTEDCTLLGEVKATTQPREPDTQPRLIEGHAPKIASWRMNRPTCKDGSGLDDNSRVQPFDSTAEDCTLLGEVKATTQPRKPGMQRRLPIISSGRLRRKKSTIPSPIDFDAVQRMRERMKGRMPPGESDAQTSKRVRTSTDFLFDNGSGNIRRIFDQAMNEAEQECRKRLAVITKEHTQDTKELEDMIQRLQSEATAASKLQTETALRVAALYEINMEHMRMNRCKICMRAKRDTLTVPCMHFEHCLACLQTVGKINSKCPICRSPWNALLQVRYA